MGKDDLGLGKIASGDEVKKASRETALIYIPDKNTSEPGVYLQDIAESYTVLSNSNKTIV